MLAQPPLSNDERQRSDARFFGLALITGASRGIGKATAKLLAQEGAKVILIDRDSESLQATEKEFAKYQPICRALDLVHEQEVEHVFSELKELTGRLDIVVNNAAVNILESVEDCTPASFHRTLEINVTAAVSVCRHAVKLMGPNGA